MIAGDHPGITYDSAKYAVSVQITDENGDLRSDITYPKGGVAFKNTYEKPDPSNPNPGDETPLFLLCSGCALVLMLILERRSNRQ